MDQNRSAILTYHSVDGSGSVISISPPEFARQMESLANSPARIVSLKEVRDHPGSIALTFDDGFRNFLTEVAPVLERYRFPATVFVVTGFCGRDNRWPGQRPEIPKLPLMDWDELRELSERGFEIGGHTVHHPDLKKLAPDAAMREMQGCKSEIEDRLGRAVTQFAYPYGRIPGGVRPPFELACGTRMDYLMVDADPLDLPRVDAYYLRSGPPAGSVLSRSSAVYIGARAIVRNLRQWLSQ